MPLSLSQRNPELVARVDAAFERAAAGPETIIGGTALAASLTEQAFEEATVMPESAFDPSEGLEDIENPDTREQFKNAFAAHEQLFQHIDLPVPTAEKLASAGTDLNVLAIAFERMTQEGQDPQIVLAPYMALSEWQDLYRELEDHANPNTHVKIWAPISEKQWSDFNQPPKDVPYFDDEGKDTLWTVRLLPAANVPDSKTVHDNPKYKDTHPSVAEYLSLTATLLNNQQQLSDQVGTWLYTPLSSLMVPHAQWAKYDGELQLQATPGDMVSGVRPAVWKDELKELTQK